MDNIILGTSLACAAGVAAAFRADLRAGGERASDATGRRV